MLDVSKKSEKILRVAWMYFILGKNQHEIAAQLAVSRPTIQRLIAAAKDRGIVSVNIHHPIATCLSYAELLRERFDLRLCHIVPDNAEENVRDNLAFGGAQLMNEYISSQETLVIGIGSGRILKRVVNRIAPRAHSEKKFVSLISTIAADGQYHYDDDVPLILTRRVNAPYYQFPAPRYISPLDAHKFWCHNSLYDTIYAVADTANVTFFDVGSVTTDDFISVQQARELVEQGAVGEILGTFVDINGNVLDHDINLRNTSYNVRRNRNLRIGIGGGDEKRKAILAALRGKWISGLVTDETTGKWLLTK